LLSRDEVAALMGPSDYFDAVESAFRASAIGKAHSPPPMHIHAPLGGFHAKGALLFTFGGFRTKGPLLLAERAVVAVKLNGNFPGNPERTGLPTIQGVILLCDGGDGAVLSILDSTEITKGRTAGASALAAKHLAREDAATLGVCGCGSQAGPHALALAQVRSFKRCFAWDIDPEKAKRFATHWSPALPFPVEATLSAREATRDSDVIVTCTTAATPFLAEGDVSAGAFIAAVGADSPQKSEIMPMLMAKARVVTDSLDQCLVMGDLHHAVRAGAMSAGDVHAELADVVVGARPGRSAPDEIIIFDSTGTAIQDAASAAIAYERARQRGRGLSFVLA
jgi:ornithine cyclodeaminase/alanine dehydrogenase-like protein (mu-crystallin family)